MEIAAKLGLSPTHAFDVTTACVGHLEALQTAAAYLALHPRYRTALVCTSELSGDFLDYDIQSVRELSTKFAGLTIGNGGATGTASVPRPADARPTSHRQDGTPRPSTPSYDAPVFPTPAFEQPAYEEPTFTEPSYDDTMVADAGDTSSEGSFDSWG